MKKKIKIILLQMKLALKLNYLTIFNVLQRKIPKKSIELDEYVIIRLHF